MYLIFYFLFQQAQQGFTTVIVVILFLGGIQLLSISFVSEYIIKILEETKNRPKFIIKEIINDNKNKK